MLQPVKSPKGHRLYRREDVQTVLEIRRLLYDEGFTIAGARRHLREHEGHAGGHNGERRRTGRRMENWRTASAKAICRRHPAKGPRAIRCRRSAAKCCWICATRCGHS